MMEIQRTIKFGYWVTIILWVIATTACNDSSEPLPIVPETAFSKGADVSWLTEMEAAGRLFYNKEKRPTDGLELMKELGMNAIRLRVFVNPPDGWCGTTDVVNKAYRAHLLGLKLLIDFHYSDSWADPGQQTKPAAWSHYSLEQLQQAVTQHTTEVLRTLKAKGVAVSWVQVGNETPSGMLWPEGRITGSDFGNFTRLCNSGYKAVKAVYPHAKVIIHLNDGANSELYRWFFDGLRMNQAQWDVIGLSLYPSWSTESWQTQSDKCIANMKELTARYHKEVMLCEVGMPCQDAASAKAFLTDIIGRSKAIEGNRCLGVFYWEPQAYNNWKGYDKGAFDKSGQPTEALDAFKN